jgi:hypothetical protein
MYSGEITADFRLVKTMSLKYIDNRLGLAIPELHEEPCSGSKKACCLRNQPPDQLQSVTTTIQGHGRLPPGSGCQDGFGMGHVGGIGGQDMYGSRPGSERVEQIALSPADFQIRGKGTAILLGDRQGCG